MSDSGMIVDVLVIGGGIVGCACAYEIARRGMTVVLLERDSPGAGATGPAGGFVSVATKRPGPHRELARASAGIYASLAAGLDVTPDALGYRATGTLIVAEDEADLRVLAGFREERRDLGLDLESLSPRHLHLLEPGLSPALAGGLFCPGDASVMPLGVLHAYRKAAERLGARFRCGEEVRRARRSGEGWILETAAGMWAAPQVILAAGAWSGRAGELFGINVPVEPRRGQALLLDAPEALIGRPLLAARYLGTKFEERAPTGERTGAGSVEAGIALSLWERPDGRLFAGGTREWAGFDRTPNGALLAEIRRRAERVVPGLGKAPDGQAVLGFRPYSRTGLPLIGPVPGVPGLHLATGHEGDGVSLAPITARLVAQALVGEPPAIDLRPFALPAAHRSTGPG